MSLIIGIDLGTSTTEAAIFRNGAPEMILNLDGQEITPSAVGLDAQGNWVAGSRARAQYLLEPEKTAIEVKRMTGLGETIRLGNTEYEPVELQGKLLSYVREYAKAYLGEDVTRAVISVPAYFDHAQRMETILAGEKAGFEVERILNEPTAAAMSYGLEHLEEESRVLVYDLGGGTFDVTLLEMYTGVLEVEASSGDNQLGGKDFDEKLEEELLRRFRKKTGVDLRKDRVAMARVKDAAEKCKFQLSVQPTARVQLPALCVKDNRPLEMNETVSREEFESLTADLLSRTHAPMERVLDDAGLSAADIDHIILVGGSTRMPMIARDIEAFFGKEPTVAVHPDFAVATGAAIQAGIISGEIDPSESLVMTDVAVFTLGVRAGDWTENFDLMSPIIQRNTTIPVSRTQRYYTSAPGQRQALVEVYQGESRSVSHNHFLGEFLVKGIPEADAGEEAIDVTFAYDMNALLKVTAVIASNGEKAEMEINLMEKKEKLDLSKWKDAPHAREYRTLIRRAERILSQNDDETDGRMIEIRRCVDRLKEALIREDDEKIRDYVNRLEVITI